MPITDASRTYSLHIYSPRGTDYRIEVDREILRTYENGDVARVESTLVKRTLSSIASKPLPGGAVELATYGALAALIAECANELAAEDEAARATEPEFPNP